MHNMESHEVLLWDPPTCGMHRSSSNGLIRAQVMLCLWGD